MGFQRVWHDWATFTNPNFWASLVAQMVKRLPAMRETQVRSLGREDPLEKEMAIDSSTLAWKIPWMEEPDRLQSMGSQRVGHDWATSLSLFTFSSVTHLCLILCNPKDCSIPGLSITNSQKFLKLMFIYSVMPSNHLILCHPLLLPSTFPSIRVFSNELALHIRWSKYWSFSFSLSPSNEYSGLISFRIDWFGFFVVQRTLKSLLQHHNSKASIL